MPEQSPKPNGVMALLSTLAHSTDKWVQLGTLGLIALSGFGNWLATWNSSDRNKQEIEVSRRVAWEGEQRIREDVRKQVADIHEWMRRSTEEFHQGNEDSAKNRKTLAGILDDIHASQANQTQMLKNQTALLEGQNAAMERDSRILAEINRALAPVTIERAYPSPTPRPKQ